MHLSPTSKLGYLSFKRESHSHDFFLVDDGCFVVGRKIGKIYNRSTAESTTTYVLTVRNLPTTATDDHAHNRGDLSTTSYSTTIYNFARLSLRLSAPPLFLKHGESNQKAIVNDSSDRLTSSDFLTKATSNLAYYFLLREGPLSMSLSGTENGIVGREFLRSDSFLLALCGTELFIIGTSSDVTTCSE